MDYQIPGCLITRIADRFVRSEEHTSELQSLTNLVCRLLLEKKIPSSDLRIWPPLHGGPKWMCGALSPGGAAGGVCGHRAGETGGASPVGVLSVCLHWVATSEVSPEPGDLRPREEFR